MDDEVTGMDAMEQSNSDFQLSSRNLTEDFNIAIWYVVAESF